MEQHLSASLPLAQQEWFELTDPAQVDTPALLVYPDRVLDNIRRALLLVGDANRLRPHIKTCKCGHTARMMMEEGISRFKCATIAEAELLAMAGAPDVLLAYQPVGPKVDRLLHLVNNYPKTQFSCLVDHPVPARAIGAAAFRLALNIPVYIDLNVGMNRTGIVPGDEALDLYEVCHRQKGIEPVGLHVYDGHISHSDLHQRRAATEAAMAPVEAMQHELVRRGFTKPLIIAGGSPTLLIHAQHPERECSPGTFVYWDAGYGTAFPELPFMPAALVLCRVVSVQNATHLTLDLGHKSVAPENSIDRRVRFLNAPAAQLTMQSEEHAVVALPEGHGFTIGDVLYGLPYHICPTVAQYEKALAVVSGRVADEWATRARDRSIQV